MKARQRKLRESGKSKGRSRESGHFMCLRKAMLQVEPGDHIKVLRVFAEMG